MTETNSISVKNVSKQFKGGIKAVNNVSFDVKAGSIFAFLGPNGAGKTTTIKMLTTLLRHDSGEIFLNGIDPVVRPEDARRTFGIVFQDPSLDDELTAYENMYLHAGLYGISRKNIDTKIGEMLDFVELSDRRNDLVKRFSGGMKRRLEIARGLLHTPSILFLDEPTVGLDPQTRNHIWDYIKRLNKERGLTVFFTTHYMDEVERVADTVAIIDHGHIIMTDTVAGVIGKNNSKSLEEAFIALTGKNIRADEAGAADHMRQHAKLWRGSRR